MNKSSAAGFLVGVVVFALLGVGYLVVSNTSGKAPAKPTIASPKTTPAPTTADPKAKPAMPVRVANDKAIQNTSQISLSREVPGSTYAPGASVDVTVTIANGGTETVRAMGFVEELPEGWTFDGVVSTDRPDLSPPKGRPGKLEFAWFNIPKFPATFTYRATVPANADGPKEVSGEALYRTDGPEQRTGLVTTVLTPAAAAAAPAAPAPEAAPAPAAPAASAPETAPAAAAPTPEPAPAVAAEK